MSKSLWLARASTSPELDKIKVRPITKAEAEEIRRKVDSMPSPFPPCDCMQCKLGRWRKSTT